MTPAQAKSLSMHVLRPRTRLVTFSLELPCWRLIEDLLSRGDMPAAKDHYVCTVRRRVKLNDRIRVGNTVYKVWAIAETGDNEFTAEVRPEGKWYRRLFIS